MSGIGTAEIPDIVSTLFYRSLTKESHLISTITFKNVFLAFQMCLCKFQKSVYRLATKTVASFLSTAFSAVINIGLNALLIPRMGGTGAALATLISYVALFLYRAIDSRRFMPVRWKVPRLALTVILLTVQSMLMLLEPPLWLVWQIALFGAVAALNSREMLLSVKKLLHRA